MDNPEESYLLKRALNFFETGSNTVNDQIELIVAVLMILLDQPAARQRCTLFLSDELTTKIEGRILERICAVLNKTYLIRGEKYLLPDDSALELIRDLILEHDEFMFYSVKNLILRNTSTKRKVKSAKSR